MILRRILLALFAVSVFLTVAPRAWATSTITLNPALISRSASTVNGNHGMVYPPVRVSYADCVANDVITIPITLSALDSTSTLQVWAGGSDCSTAASRTGTDSRVCWPVTPNLTQAITLQIPVRVQDVVSHANQSNQSLASVPTAYTQASAASCEIGGGPYSISVYVMLVPNGGGDSSVEAPLAFTIKLGGPPPPTNVTAAAGDTLVNVSWGIPTDPSQDTQGFFVFIDPPIGGGATDGSSPEATTMETLVCADGGLTDGGFDDAGNPIPGTQIDAGGCHLVDTTTPAPGPAINNAICGSSLLYVPGTDGGTLTTTLTDEAGVDDEGGVPTNTITKIGANGGSPALHGYLVNPEQGKAVANDTITGLQNGVLYQVGVAGVDSYGNIGYVSANPACATPAPIDDFWKVCKVDGCGGDGSCALQTPGSQGAAFFGVGMFGILAMYIKRRRK